MDQTWSIDSPTSREVGGPQEPVTHVTVTVVGGRVDVVGRPEPGPVHLEVHDVAGPPLTGTLSAGRFRLDGHKDSQGQVFGVLKDLVLGGRAPTARITLTVPRGTRVSVTSAGADVLVAGVAADVSVTTVSGLVRLLEVDGRADVKTVSGEIESHSPNGELRAKTVSGDITVGGGNPRAVRISSMSGATVIDLHHSPALITTNSVSGDVTVRLPHGRGYDVTASSSSGHVVVDGQTLSSGPNAEKGGHRSEGDRGIAVKSRTMSGNVVVLRGEDLAQTRSSLQDVRPSDRARVGQHQVPPPPAGHPGQDDA